nr:hypothetical protein [Treponema sp.]
MADILQAAKSFKNLLDVEYQILLGKKNKQLNLSIDFERLHFYHLAGLHYLKDLADTLKGDRGIVFEKILDGKITQADLESSIHYPEIKDRIEYLVYLESLMDSNETIFKYNPALEAFSAIRADFLLKNQVQARNIFIFLSGDKSNGKYFCRSFFPQTDKDYSLGQTNWTLLYKKKLRKSAKTETMLYDRMKR